MKIFTHTNFEGVWLGGVAVVVAHDKKHAAKLLTEEIKKQELPEQKEINPDDFEQISITFNARAIILFDGDF